MKRILIMWIAMVTSVTLSFIYPEKMNWWTILLLCVAISVVLLETFILGKAWRRRNDN